MNRLTVAPVTTTTLTSVDPSSYHAVIGSVGFESRSREILMALTDVGRRAAVPFRDRQEVAFSDNIEQLTAAEFELPELTDERQSVEWLAKWIRQTACDPEVTRLAVDVSSMTRPRIGAVIEMLFELPDDCSVEADLLYTPAAFRPLGASDDPPVLNICPVSGYYAGWWSDLEAPLHAVIGLGYELERASSAIDHLEPASFEVLIPRGIDGRYLTEVERANDALFKTPNLERHGYYEVPEPFACFQMLEASVHRRSENERIALLPLGPKIFAAAAMLVGALHPQHAQVIRVTAADKQEARDQVSDDQIYGIRLVMRPAELVSRPEIPPILDELDSNVDAGLE